MQIHRKRSGIALLIIVAAFGDAAPAAQAQFVTPPEPNGVCVFNCGGASSSPVPAAPIVVAPAFNVPSFNLGLQYLRSGDYASAVAAFERANGALPNDPMILAKLAEARALYAAERAASALGSYNAQNYDAAGRAYRQAAEINPNLRSTYLAYEKIATEAAEQQRRQQEEERQFAAAEKMYEGNLAAEAKLAYERNLAKLAAETARKNSELEHANQLRRAIRRIEVPPPVPPETARIGFGQLAPEDARTFAALTVADGTIASVSVVAQFADKVESGLFWAKFLMLFGKAGISGLDGAQVYAIRQNEVYEKALFYLRNQATRERFTDTLRRLQKHQPLPENASVDMARTAEAVLDTRRGNRTEILPWDALMSREAKNAALSRLAIELLGAGASRVLEKGTEKAVQAALASRMPAYREAVDFLAHAKLAKAVTKSPVAQQSLKEATDLANAMIRDSFRIAQPDARAVGKGVDFFADLFVQERSERGRDADVEPPLHEPGRKR